MVLAQLDLLLSVLDEKKRRRLALTAEVRARLQNGSRGHRVETERITLSLGASSLERNRHQPGCFPDT
jgi:hypothetical protein